MRPSGHFISLLLASPFSGLVSASHHLALCDQLNGYCLHFFTSPKAFNK